MSRSAMHTFECMRYPSLSFYTCGKKKKFVSGVYKTRVAKEIKVLEKLDDVKEISDSVGDTDD